MTEPTTYTPEQMEELQRERDEARHEIKYAEAKLDAAGISTDDGGVLLSVGGRLSEVIDRMCEAEQRAEAAEAAIARLRAYFVRELEQVKAIRHLTPQGLEHKRDAEAMLVRFDEIIGKSATLRDESERPLPLQSPPSGSAQEPS